MILSRVVCGFGETIETFEFTTILTKEDFPTLGLPTTEMNKDFVFISFNFTSR